jgi:hypothetical protein
VTVGSAVADMGNGVREVEAAASVAIDAATLRELAADLIAAAECAEGLL